MRDGGRCVELHSDKIVSVPVTSPHVKHLSTALGVWPCGPRIVPLELPIQSTNESVTHHVMDEKAICLGSTAMVPKGRAS